MRHLLPALMLALTPGLGFAQAAGDPAVGESTFARQCVACHVVVDPDGNVLAGRRGRTGPNLFGVTGRVVGSVDGFRYGAPITELHDQGVAWDRTNFIGYVQDPTNWLRARLADPSARGKMAYKVRSAADAANLYAYLQSLAE